MPRTRKTPAGEAPGAAVPKDAPPKKAARKAPAREKAAQEPAAKLERHRFVFPLAVYDPRKDEVKAPLKEHGLAWQFLGQGKGRYHKEGVNLFVQFTDAGVDYTLWGADEATVDAILAAWERALGPEEMRAARERGQGAHVQEKAAEESEETRLWRMGEPQPRPGEPELFLRKRREEWLARRPGG